MTVSPTARRGSSRCINPFGREAHCLELLVYLLRPLRSQRLGLGRLWLHSPGAKEPVEQAGHHPPLLPAVAASSGLPRTCP